MGAGGVKAIVNIWADTEDADGFEMVRRHQELYRGLLAQQPAGSPT